jgi:hypothetical protein
MNGGDREMSEDPSDEAAWRDLVAHYVTPGAADGTPAPWPTREDLPGPGTPGEEEASPDSSGQDTADLDVTGLDMASPDDPDADAAQPGPRWPEVPGPFGGMTRARRRSHRPVSQPRAATRRRRRSFRAPGGPPLPRLDPITKGAWAALFGGPAYLLIAVVLSGGAKRRRSPPWRLLSVVSRPWSCAWVTSRRARSGPDDRAVV